VEKAPAHNSGKKEEEVEVGEEGEMEEENYKYVK
jgi:hypothetical protein